MSTKCQYDLADLELVFVELFQLPLQTKAGLYLYLRITPLKRLGAWGVTLRKFLKFTIDNGNQLHPLAAITMEKGTPLLIGISCSR
jgi:hypothetical protein